MLLQAAALLGWLVLALGGAAYAAALRARSLQAQPGARRRAALWHRLFCWAALGWTLASVWVFLDTLVAMVGP